MLKREKRIQELAFYLKLNNACTIKELSSKFNVSEMTARRDLSVLESRSIIRFIHGVAVYNQNNSSASGSGRNAALYGSDYLFRQHIVKNKQEKIQIAREAAKLIEPDESVMIDSGTTTTYLCKEIGNDLFFTAICWALNILVVLSSKQNCRLVSYGGYFHPETRLFENPYPSEFIKYTRASKAFISAGGIHPELGVTCPLSYEFETKRVAIESSKTKILLLDSTKFGKICSTHFANVDDFDIIVSDKGVDESFQRDITSKGVKLILA